MLLIVELFILELAFQIITDGTLKFEHVKK